MRCFISLDLPEDVKDYLASVQREFREINGANIVQKENLHVTLAFLGEVDEGSLAGILEKAERIAADFRSFECALARLQIVPARMPRIVWVSLDCKSRLNEIHSALCAALLPGRQEFSSHITLARIKNAAAAKQILQKAKGINISPKKFCARHISIMKSVLAPSGPEYSVIRQVKLPE